MPNRHPPSPGRSSRSKGSSLDRVFEALSHPHRRRILTAIAEGSPGGDAEFTPDDFTPDDFTNDGATNDEFLMLLHHVHLPTLSDSGFVAWDPDAGTVRRGPRWDRVAPTVEVLIEHEDELPGDWP